MTEVTNEKSPPERAFFKAVDQDVVIALRIESLAHVIRHRA
jgi:hypothetical protein